MTTDSENPYKVLGVERTADERTIKRAYVALIRKFTPEGHPEDFKRIRAAYELLSDAALRARFDDSEKGYDEYGEELSRRLADADAALEKHNGELALEILRDVVARFPDASLARSKLAFLHLSEQRFEQALAEFETLADKEPDTARHQLHCAMALARLERTPQVERRLLEARRLDPKDVGIALNLAGFYVAHARIDDVTHVVDSVIPSLPPGSPAVFALLSRKVEALALAHRAQELTTVLHEIKCLAEASSDPEVFPFVTSEISTIAAKLFVRKEPTAANRILAYCKELRPATTLECPFPAAVVSDPARLPDAFRSWLEAVGTSQESYALRHATWLLPILALLVSAGFAAFALLQLADTAATKQVGTYATTFAVSFLAVAALALAVGWILRILASPVRSMTTLHPLYLIRATPLRVRLYPLFMLTDAHGVHQHTNGAYTGTSITLTFGEGRTREVVRFGIRGKQQATEWLDTLFQVRGRSLELFAEGCLDAEALVDDLPPAALAKLPSPASKRSLMTSLAVAALVAAVCTPILTRRRVQTGEDEVFSSATSSGSLSDLRAFVRDHSDSRHLPLAKQLVDERFATMIEHLRLDPSSPGEAALVRAVESVQKHGGGLSVSANVSGDAFGAQDAASTAASLHVTEALTAAGLEPLLGGGNGPRISVRIAQAPQPIELQTESEAPPKVLPSVMGKKGVLRFLLSGPPLYAYGANVTVTIDLPDGPSFSTRADIPAATHFYAAGNDLVAVASLKQALLARSLEAATHALGLHGPPVRLDPPEPKQQAAASTGAKSRRTQ